MPTSGTSQHWKCNHLLHRTHPAHPCSFATSCFNLARIRFFPCASCSLWCSCLPPIHPRQLPHRLRQIATLPSSHHAQRSSIILTNQCRCLLYVLDDVFSTRHLLTSLQSPTTYPGSCHIARRRSHSRLACLSSCLLLLSLNHA